MLIHGRRTSTVTIFMLAALLTVSTVCRKSTVTPTSELGDAECDVLSAYLTGKFAGQKGEELVGKSMVKIAILNMTQPSKHELLLQSNGQPILWTEMVKALLKEAPGLQPATLDAYRAANAQQAYLRRSFHTATDCELVDSARLDSFFKNNGGGWPAYYKQYPRSQGILAFSRVGFSADGTQGFFYLSNRCGELCGGGWYVVMEKQNGSWAMAREIENWVS
jgi:hypothetical protein